MHLLTHYINVSSSYGSMYVFELRFQFGDHGMCIEHPYPILEWMKFSIIYRRWSSATSFFFFSLFHSIDSFIIFVIWKQEKMMPINCTHFLIVKYNAFPTNFRIYSRIIGKSVFTKCLNTTQRMNNSKWNTNKPKRQIK